jgi:molybdate transport system substrate-binding protein
VSAVKILSGGAAQGLVNALAPRFLHDTGLALEGEFGAVGAMHAKLRAGAAADVLILTQALIEELARNGLAVMETATDLGVVHTAVAVRSGDHAPGLRDASELRRALLAADQIFFPNPKQATAGIHFAAVLQKLGLTEQVAPRLKTYPNGATAMRALAASTGSRPIGCTQVTEILNTTGATLVGPLPPGCELATTYTAAVASRAEHLDEARALVALLSGRESADARRQAGFAESSPAPS